MTNQKIHSSPPKNLLLKTILEKESSSTDSKENAQKTSFIGKKSPYVPDKGKKGNFLRFQPPSSFNKSDFSEIESDFSETELLLPKQKTHLQQNPSKKDEPVSKNSEKKEKPKKESEQQCFPSPSESMPSSGVKAKLWLFKLFSSWSLFGARFCSFFAEKYVVLLYEVLPYGKEQDAASLEPVLKGMTTERAVALIKGINASDLPPAQMLDFFKEILNKLDTWSFAYILYALDNEAFAPKKKLYLGSVSRVIFGQLPASKVIRLFKEIENQKYSSTQNKNLAPHIETSLLSLFSMTLDGDLSQRRTIIEMLYNSNLKSDKLIALKIFKELHYSSLYDLFERMVAEKPDLTGSIFAHSENRYTSSFLSFVISQLKNPEYEEKLKENLPAFILAFVSELQKIPLSKDSMNALKAALFTLFTAFLQEERTQDLSMAKQILAKLSQEKRHFFLGFLFRTENSLFDGILKLLSPEEKLNFFGKMVSCRNCTKQQKYFCSQQVTLLRKEIKQAHKEKTVQNKW